MIVNPCYVFFSMNDRVLPWFGLSFWFVAFPDKLHEMLCQESSDDPASAIVSWLPHGRAFIVRKPKEFTTEIMPKYVNAEIRLVLLRKPPRFLPIFSLFPCRYFRQTKLTSFQRQLNLYGFRRITQGADSGAYYHSLFLQGRPSLSQRMVRQKVKGTGHKQPSDASSEPNFYSMPPVEPEYSNSTTWGARYKPTILPPMKPDTPLQVPKPDIPEESHEASGIDPNSPGLSSLHGAAQLLHGISSGNRGSVFLGPPATKSSSPNSNASPRGKKKPASFLYADQLQEPDFKSAQAYSTRLPALIIQFSIFDVF